MSSKLKSFAIIALIASFNGCKDGNSVGSDKNITNSNKVKLNKKKIDNKNDLSKKIGISTEGDKIVIEPKKTKAFFDKLAKTLEKEAKALEGKAKKVNENDIGISASKDKITIDLNKTKSFLDDFAKQLEGVAKNIDKAINK